MRFLDVTDATFDEAVLASDVPVIAHFTAPWCEPCKAVAEHLAELADGYGDQVRLAQIDIDANLIVPSRYDVLSLPTVILFVHGEPRNTIAGAQPRRRYQAALAPHLV
jgi:thioredoxin 1